MTKLAAIKERPIRFKPWEILAILKGNKTMMRRVIKEQPSVINGELQHHVRGSIYRTGLPASNLCPYGKPGDRLWVKEAFCLFDPHPDGDLHAIGQERLSKGCIAPYVGVENDRPIFWTACYRADGELEHPIYGAASWKPSTNMPRWASRILLEVVSVRVERLQEITDEDVEAEGVWHHPGCFYFGDVGNAFEHVYDHSGFSVDGELKCDCGGYSFRELFESTWNDINGKDSWRQNPWCWVVEFKRVDN